MGIGSAPTRSTLLLSTLLLVANVRSQQQIPNLNATALNWAWSTAWEGNDGNWGTFWMHVGTPSQVVRVLPATTWQETWVIDTEACRGSTPEQCNDLRGKTYNVNSSSTWSDQGLFKTDLAKDLGYNAIGDYGMDKLGLTNADSGVTLEDQVVVTTTSNQWYIGLFGLGNQPTNFSDFNNPQPSFLTSLYNKGLIPSLSWGYQVGAEYRGKTSSASVIFGGYDDSRYIDNSVIFTQSNDFSFPFVVSLSSIAVSGIYVGGQQGKAELLDSSWLRQSDNQLISIDSVTPYLWLTNETCAIFESALNITYNEDAELYLLTDEHHDQLLDLNPTFTFTMSDTSQNDTSLVITVPYSAFSLQAKGKEILGADGKFWYFPIKRLPEGGNPRLGRAFMQEIYLFAEYHFNTFRVFQADWSNRDANIITHLPVKLVADNKQGKSTPIGAIVGGVVGGVVVIAAIVGGWLWYRRRQKKTHQPTPDPVTGFIPEIDGTATGKGTGKTANELGGDSVGAWGDKKTGWQQNSGQYGGTAVEGVHEAHGQAVEKQWNEADGTPIVRPQGEKYPYPDPERSDPQFYAELSGGDVIGPAVQELPSGEVKRDGK
ncbi:hypothetical protein ABW20_dc0108158 [Dactylellina cionopaga]|nr:hypothetical protein ABW20_dc0108158 [Dactylellina cionopaga]